MENNFLSYSISINGIIIGFSIFFLNVFFNRIFFVIESISPRAKFIVDTLFPCIIYSYFIFRIYHFVFVLNYGYKFLLPFFIPFVIGFNLNPIKIRESIDDMGESFFGQMAIFLAAIAFIVSGIMELMFI